MNTAIPKSITPRRPYATFLSTQTAERRGVKPLAGVKIGLVREHFVKNAPNDVAISDQINEEAKRVLRDELGAELVETLEPLYEGDPDVADVAYGFADAFSEIMPRQMPDHFKKTLDDGWIAEFGDGAAGKSEAVRMRDVMRMVVLKVMYENEINLFMAPENTLPPRKIGGATDPTLNRRSGVGSSSTFTALVGIPEVTLPAGFTRIVYEPRFELSEDGTAYEEVSGTEPSELPVPMPIALTFWAGPGDEPTLYKVASTYEAATKHRVPPPDFGPID